MSEGKRQALKRAGVLSTRAGRVSSPLFEKLTFFDADDRLQVKYEMLRSHEVDRLAISRAATLFGYTRQAYYQISHAFDEEGVAGLLGSKRGRKGPLRCTPEVVGFLVQEKQRHPELTASELAARLLEEKGVELHRRTVEKIVAGLGGGGRRKKKPPRGR
jgi:transposase